MTEAIVQAKEQLRDRECAQIKSLSHAPVEVQYLNLSLTFKEQKEIIKKKRRKKEKRKGKLKGPFCRETDAEMWLLSQVLGGFCQQQKHQHGILRNGYTCHHC